MGGVKPFKGGLAAPHALDARQSIVNASIRVTDFARRSQSTTRPDRPERDADQLDDLRSSTTMRTVNIASCRGAKAKPQGPRDATRG